LNETNLLETIYRYNIEISLSAEVATWTNDQIKAMTTFIIIKPKRKGATTIKKISEMNIIDKFANDLQNLMHESDHVSSQYCQYVLMWLWITRTFRMAIERHDRLCRL
jgi:hypothetical protein